MFIQIQDTIYNINSIVAIQLYEVSVWVKTNDYAQNHFFSNSTEAQQIFDRIRKTLIK